MSVDQTKADEHWNRPSMDTCQGPCGMQFRSDDDMLDRDELCHECARDKRERDADFGEWAGAISHGMGRDYEMDSLREMYDEGLTVDQACAELTSARIDWAMELAADNFLRMEDFR